LDSNPLFRSTNQYHQIELSAHCQSYIETPNHYILTLKMATAMFAETLDNFQRSTLLISESRCCTTGHFGS
jgi:hypothetical protein